MNQQKREELRKKIQECTYMDDRFMTVCLQDNKVAVGLILKILLGKDIEVTSAETQVTVQNLHGRSAKLDVVAYDREGRYYNIEIQRADKGASPKRARYHQSLADADNLAAGEDPSLLPETYIIFITENDVMKKGLPLYQIERIIVQTEETFGDGSHILFVNGSYCQTAHCGRCKPHFDFGENTSPIVPYRYLPQTFSGTDADCRSLV